VAGEVSGFRPLERPGMPAIDRNLAVERKTDYGRWSNPDALEAAWDRRAELAANFIPTGARVLDLGCGKMALRRFLPDKCSYQPCDLVARDETTIVCDFNAGEFPDKAADEADVVVMLGVLEYIVDVDAFFAHLQRHKCKLVLSYCVTDFTQNADRPSLGWINHFSIEDLSVLFDRFGLLVERCDPVDNLQLLMKLRPAGQELPLAACNVAVISFNNVGNFGDRLGYHIINSLLPAPAQVHHLTFATLEQARESYDLIVLGIGNSIFKPLLNDQVFDVLGRGKAVVGIFGTQYREMIPRVQMDRLIDRLDTWFARYEDDVLIYGRGRGNVEHLGDWLITQFPMVEAHEPSGLEIDKEILNHLPLDRTIQTIQRYKKVYSTRLHPLLCALTSAEIVAYVEQRESEIPEMVSGKFRSMLVDIFGRTFPEQEYFIVDRNAVARYKARVHDNVKRVAARIDAILRNVTAAAS
jgi:hypothetical protein